MYCKAYRRMVGGVVANVKTLRENDWTIRFQFDRRMLVEEKKKVNEMVAHMLFARQATNMNYGIVWISYRVDRQWERGEICFECVFALSWHRLTPGCCAVGVGTTSTSESILFHAKYIAFQIPLPICYDCDFMLDMAWVDWEWVEKPCFLRWNRFWKQKRITVKNNRKLTFKALNHKELSVNAIMIWVLFS